MTYTPTEFELAVYRWIDSRLDGCTVIYANQGSPRPESAHATMLLTLDSEAAPPRTYLTDEASGVDFISVTVTEKQAVVSIQTFGVEAYQLLKSLVDGRRNTDSKSFLTSENLSIRGVSDVQRIFSPREADIEGRAVVNIDFGYSERLENIVEALEEVIATLED